MRIVPLGVTGVATLLLFSAACDSPTDTAAAAGSASAKTSASAAPTTLAAPSEETTAALARLARAYRGTLGKDTIVVRLDHTGGHVTGSYFTPDTDGHRTLDGTATGTHLVLGETVSGKKSGALALDVGTDGALSGTWTDATGAKLSPVHLTSVAEDARAKSALLFKRTLTETKPASKGGECKRTLAYAEVYGLPEGLEAKIDADLAPPMDRALPGTCEAPKDLHADYRIAHNADGILSVRMTSTSSEGDAAKSAPRGRTLNVILASGNHVKLFGDIVKPKAERAFEAAVTHEVAAVAAKNHLDAKGRGVVEQALGFSPPFVIEDRGIRLFPDSLPATYAAIVTEGIFVPYAMLPRPSGPVAVLWGK